MRYLIILLFLVVGCSNAPLTEDERMIREEQQVDREIAREDWKLYKESCEAAEGVVVVQSINGSRSGGVPGRGDQVGCFSQDAVQSMMHRRLR